MIAKLCWSLLAALHLVPALATVRPSLLTSLYGVQAGGTPFLLLHHRAALFLAIAALCVWALFDPRPRPAAVLATGISMISFLALYAVAGAPAQLKGIALADLIGLPALAYVAWIAFSGR